jgi:hypothetical protein
VKVSHQGATVVLGRFRFGPGTARALAALAERKVRSGHDPVVVKAGTGKIRLRATAVARMAAALRRHAAAAEVVRGPVGGGALRGDKDAFERVDELFGRFGSLLEPRS